VSTQMFREAAAASQVVALQLQACEQVLSGLADSIATDRPTLFLTCARGSSDHAATFFRYLVEARLGVITSSFHPSVNSVYGQSPPIGNGIGVVISQSGQSPDIVSFAQRYRDKGNRILAIVNDENSPLAQTADFVLPLCAGREVSVAATKSFIASLFAAVQFVARYAEAGITQHQLQSVPELLDRAWGADWGALVEGVHRASGLFVIGRGPGFAVAAEAALKLKETAAIHAEAFSAAEIRHGPMALLTRDFPLLVFRQNDAGASSVDAFARFAVAQGCKVFVVGKAIAGAVELPCVVAPPIIQPLVQIQSFYRAANDIAVARGRNPDRPANLNKVTETV
jgi:glutamine---fructose-6-phosphate transaminase (isomerizing)